jgi:hypothetical protein
LFGWPELAQAPGGTKKDEVGNNLPNARNNGYSQGDVAREDGR